MAAMAEPLSILGTILALVSGCSKAIAGLADAKRRYNRGREAPTATASLQFLIAECSAMNSILAELEIVFGSQLSRSARNAVQLDHLFNIMTNTQEIVSELNAKLAVRAALAGPGFWAARVEFMLEESDMTALLERVRSNKACLILMQNILQSPAGRELQDAVAELTGLVGEMVKKAPWQWHTMRFLKREGHLFETAARVNHRHSSQQFDSAGDILASFAFSDNQDAEALLRITSTPSPEVLTLADVELDRVSLPRVDRSGGDETNTYDFDSDFSGEEEDEDEDEGEGENKRKKEHVSRVSPELKSVRSENAKLKAALDRSGNDLEELRRTIEQLKADSAAVKVQTTGIMSKIANDTALFIFKSHSTIAAVRKLQRMGARSPGAEMPAAQLDVKKAMVTPEIVNCDPSTVGAWRFFMSTAITELEDIQNSCARPTITEHWDWEMLDSDATSPQREAARRRDRESSYSPAVSRKNSPATSLKGQSPTADSPPKDKSPHVTTPKRGPLLYTSATATPRTPRSSPLPKTSEQSRNNNNNKDPSIPGRCAVDRASSVVPRLKPVAKVRPTNLKLSNAKAAEKSIDDDDGHHHNIKDYQYTHPASAPARAEEYRKFIASGVDSGEPSPWSYTPGPGTSNTVPATARSTSSFKFRRHGFLGVPPSKGHERSRSDSEILTTAPATADGNRRLVPERERVMTEAVNDLQIIEAEPRPHTPSARDIPMDLVSKIEQPAAPVVLHGDSSSPLPPAALLLDIPVNVAVSPSIYSPDPSSMIEICWDGDDDPATQLPIHRHDDLEV